MSSLTDGDETTPIANLTRNTDGVVDIMDEEKSKLVRAKTRLLVRREIGQKPK
jgi:hypothetical protein